MLNTPPHPVFAVWPRPDCNKALLKFLMPQKVITMQENIKVKLAMTLPAKVSVLRVC